MPATFSGNPKTEWLAHPTAGDREMALLEDFSFTDAAGKVWPAPKGARINGASIPRALWSTVGSPYTDDYRNASVVHDVACDGATPAQRRAADRMFREACIVGGCSEPQARLLYLGVRLGAWADSKAFAAPLPSRRKSLFRLPGRKSDAEIRILARYTEGAARLLALGANPTLKEIDAVIGRLLVE